MASLKNNPRILGIFALAFILLSIVAVYFLMHINEGAPIDDDSGYVPTTSPQPPTTPRQTPTIAPRQFADYEVHEWGVIAGCDNNTSWILTSRPEEVLIVKQPVVYIHSSKYGGKVESFSARAVFADGRPTITYPEAQLVGSKAEWKNVKILGEKKLISRATKSLVPLESILSDLNDVEADLLSYNGTDARFLFYEGEMKFYNNVKVDYDIKSMKAKVTNNFNCDVYDVTISVKEDPNFISGKYFLGSLDVLPAGKSIEVKLAETPNYPDLNAKMLSIGFTEKESEAFQRLWQGPFFYPTNLGKFAKLSYRIPQAEVEKLIKLEFDPEPKKKLRTLWVVVDIEDKKSGTGPKDCISDADCAWVSTNCCPENAGAYWECVNPSKLKLNCSAIRQMCLQVIRPKPETACVCKEGICTAS
ncbi:MAG: hypothetical protein N3F05_03565 [Candidatus Diapherotrites archaeon]|nr:hypothetical protein [Candidatus Diapherotrites archaeon]